MKTSNTLFTIYFLLFQPFVLLLFLGSLARGDQFEEVKDPCILGQVYRMDSCKVVAKEYGFPFVSETVYTEILVDRNGSEFVSNRKYIAHETPFIDRSYKNGINRPMTYNDFFIIGVHVFGFFGYRLYEKRTSSNSSKLTS